MGLRFKMFHLFLVRSFTFSRFIMAFALLTAFYHPPPYSSHSLRAQLLRSKNNQMISQSILRVREMRRDRLSLSLARALPLSLRPSLNIYLIRVPFFCMLLKWLRIISGYIKAAPCTLSPTFSLPASYPVHSLYLGICALPLLSPP